MAETSYTLQTLLGKLVGQLLMNLVCSFLDAIMRIYLEMRIGGWLVYRICCSACDKPAQDK